MKALRLLALPLLFLIAWIVGEIQHRRLLKRTHEGALPEALRRAGL